MKTGARVINKETSQVGHVIIDSFRCCGDNEYLVVYDGMDYGLGTDRELLQEVEPIKPDPDFKMCGGGRGAECCIFLTVSGADGFCCERFSSLRDTLIFKKMAAQRHPEESYPLCMKEEWN